MINWQPKEKAPKKSGQMILAVFNSVTCPVVAVWNQADKRWVAAMLQCELHKGKWEDFYFENESFQDFELKVWADISCGP